MAEDSSHDPYCLEDGNDISDHYLSEKLLENLSLRFGDECDSKEEEFDEDEDQNRVSRPQSRKTVHFVDLPTASSLETRKAIPWTDDTIESSTPRKAGYRITFEIISAKTVNCQSTTGGKKKYVSYSIIIKRTPGLETRPGVLDRRYTDFLTLYVSLRKRFPSLLNDFPFPKKTLVGNYSPEVITERSVAFQHLLAFCLSVTELRRTREFHEFLYMKDVKEARRLMKLAQFEETANLLENVFFVQEKLSLHDEDFYLPVFHTLCVLVACLNAVNNVIEAQEYSEKAVNIALTRNYYDHDLTAALIVLSIRLYWTMGKDKRALELKLEELRKQGVKLNKLPTLLELVMQKDFTSITIY